MHLDGRISHFYYFLFSQTLLLWISVSTQDLQETLPIQNMIHLPLYSNASKKCFISVLPQTCVPNKLQFSQHRPTVPNNFVFHFFAHNLLNKEKLCGELNSNESSTALKIFPCAYLTYHITMFL